VIADPRAVALRWPDARVRMLAELAVVVTEAPWTLSRARLGALSDDDILHAVTLSAYFGHLNRIADAVAVPLDYTVRHQPPVAEHATPPWLAAPAAASCTPSLDLARRPASAAALAAWHAHVFERASTRITQPQRAHIARRVGELLGHASAPAAAPDPRDQALLALAEQVTLAPWRLDEASFAALRADGFDDGALFEACVVASTAGVQSRIVVALSALDRG
jgi:alkylhydroperoxidase family enzyme